MHDDRHGPLIREFLGKKRIAIWGIEDTKHDPGQWVANKFRRKGIQVIGVNPGLKGEATPELVASLTKINPPVEAVLVYVDRPQAMEAVADCIAARVPLVWLHDALSPARPPPRRSPGYRRPAVPSSRGSARCFTSSPSIRRTSASSGSCE